MYWAIYFEFVLFIQNKSLNDLDEDDFKQLWILLFEFIKETSVADDAVDNTELLISYQFILNLTQHAINCVEDILNLYNEDGYLLKTIMILQSLYTKKFKYKVYFSQLLLVCQFFFMSKVIFRQMKLFKLSKIVFIFNIK